MIILISTNYLQVQHMLTCINALQEANTYNYIFANIITFCFPGRLPIIYFTCNRALINQI